MKKKKYKAKERIVYRPVPGSHLSKSDAQIFGRRTEVLRKHYGRLTPELIVEDARSRSSPLHRFFEWDDSVAGQKYRLEQARYLNRSVKIEYLTPEGQVIETRALVTVSEAPGEYFPIAEVMSSDTYRNSLLRDALRDLRRFRYKYGSLRQLAEVFAAADKVERVLKVRAAS